MNSGALLILKRFPVADPTVPLFILATLTRFLRAAPTASQTAVNL